MQAVVVYSSQQLDCTPCSRPAVLAPAPPAKAANAPGLLPADPPAAPALPAANVGTEYQPLPAPAPAPADFEVAGQLPIAPAPAPADFEVAGQPAVAPAPPPAAVQAPAAPPAQPAVLAPPPAQPAKMYGGMQLAAQHAAATIGNALVLVRQRLAQSASSGLSFFSNTTCSQLCDLVDCTLVQHGFYETERPESAGAHACITSSCLMRGRHSCALPMRACTAIHFLAP